MGQLLGYLGGGFWFEIKNYPKQKSENIKYFKLNFKALKLFQKMIQANCLTSRLKKSKSDNSIILELP